MQAKGPVWPVVAVALLVGSGPGAGAEAAWREQVTRWREQREERLKSPSGWLAVAGLFWLNEGANRFGSGADNDIVLPAGPARGGAFLLHDGRVRLTLEPGVEATVDGAPAEAGELRADDTGRPSLVGLGRLSMHVLRRGERHGIRLRDPESPYRSAFRGLRWYELREVWRVAARFVPHPEPRPVKITNVLGQTSTLPGIGYAVFEHDGQEVRLEGVLEQPEDKELFFIFRDGTSGKETYGAGRFLYAAWPGEGEIVLDFNKAYNPPCAYNPHTTCPLPPPQNWLSLRVEAGELSYGE
jgi:uncharacterized protein (DUF1684 family)